MKHGSNDDERTPSNDRIPDTLSFLETRKQSYKTIALHGRNDHGALRSNIAPPRLRSDLEGREVMTFLQSKLYGIFTTQTKV